jgi:hypothetical protein
MEIASVVIEHGFDKALLEQIDTLRTIRLGLAEKMLHEIDATADALAELGLVDGRDKIDRAELRKELQDRVTLLRERLKNPGVIFEDEISLYAELLEQDNELGEALDDACT